MDSGRNFLNIAGPIFLAGPTASGKSDVALALAQKIRGEIVSVDSMQVYRGLNIGTAKASPGDRQRVPHHLIDILDLTQSFDAAQFCQRAGDAIQSIQARRHVPIFCGGTGLYLKAFLQGLGEAPPSDPALRASLEKLSTGELLEELCRRDPVTFDRIDRDNLRRLVRAVEVIRLTGKPFSQQRAAWSPGAEESGGARIFGLSRHASDLHQRIETRVDRMFAAGLVAETESLLTAGLENNRAAMQAIGYRQTVEHLRGLRSLNETIALVKSRTRQFSKRQLTWFRRQLPMTWIEVEPGMSAGNVAEALLQQVR